MRISLVCFSARGEELGRRLGDLFTRDGDRTSLHRCSRALPLGRWVKEHFTSSDALVFIGAAGIAVRGIAPHLVSKHLDPAVVTVDDTGRYAISLLSGHSGGANALAHRVADFIGAEAVVTTATDRNNVFAVDDWARECGYVVVNPERVKDFSARLLAGETLSLSCEFPISGSIPKGLKRGTSPDLAIGVSSRTNPETLHVVPPVAVLGVGCRKGVPASAIHDFFERFCAENKLWPAAICHACTIDMKKDEPGLQEFCRDRDIPLATFSAGELRLVPGDFKPSEFVTQHVGVDNVCERAAVAGSGDGKLLLGKTARNGITMAVALKECTISFSSPKPKIEDRT